MTGSVQVAGGMDRLRRACRLAGESFGHEDATLPVGQSMLLPRALWFGCGLVALAGLAWLAFD